MSDSKPIAALTDITGRTVASGATIESSAQNTWEGDVETTVLDINDALADLETNHAVSDATSVTDKPEGKTTFDTRSSMLNLFVDGSGDDAGLPHTNVVTLTGATATYTATDEDTVILANRTVDLTITLPTAANRTNKVFWIKNMNPDTDDAVVIDGSGSETIDGRLQFVLDAEDQVVGIISDGTNWHILYEYDPRPRKDLIINGGCVVSQRVTAVTMASGNDTLGEATYASVDRFAFFHTTTSTTGTFGQNTSSSIGITGNSVHFDEVSTATKLHIVYRVEAQDAAILKGKRGSITCRVLHDMGASRTITIKLSDPTVADVWDGSAQAAISDDGGTSVADATETLLRYDNIDFAGANPERGIEIEIELDNAGAMTTKDFELTELTFWNTPNSKEYMSKPHSEILPNCQRYYRKSYQQTVAPGTATEVGRVETTAAAQGSVWIIVPIVFGTPMRGTPNITVYDDAGTSGTVTTIDSLNEVDGVAHTLRSSGQNGFSAGCDVSTETGTAFQYVAEKEL